VAAAPRPAPLQPVAQGAPTPLVTTATMATASLKLVPQVVNEDGQKIIGFPWSQAVAAAAFRRGGRLWIAFDRAAAIDLGALPGALQIDHPAATVVALPVDNNVPAMLERRGTAWLVRTGTSAEPGALEISRDDRSRDGATVRVGPAEPSGVFAVVDPDAGERVLIAPLRDRAAVRAGAEFTEFLVPETIQGIVIVARADLVTVGTLVDGVVVSAPGGLAMVGARGAEGADAVNRPVLMRLTTWRGGDEPVRDQRQALQTKVAEARPERRNSARRDLAQFLFAHNLAPEALGVMQRALRDDPTLERDAVFRTLRGAARLQQNDLAGAAADLNHASLDTEPEFQLWRGLLAVRQGDHGKARERFANTGAAMGTIMAGYPGDWRARFRLAAARAELNGGGMDAAAAHLRGLDGDALDGGMRADRLLLEAQVALAKGDRDAAQRRFTAAKAAGDRRARVVAELASVNEALAAGKLKPSEAADRLDAQRYAWRGDAVELSLLRRLGEVQFEAGDYRGGFATMKQALAYFPNAAERPEIARGMSEAFARLFTGAEAEKLPAHVAVGLYDEFKELTPGGNAGDQVVRKLADKLARVDLLDRSAKLLEQQLPKLQGLDKAQTGTQLARLYVLDRKPNEALRALQGSSTTGLPEPVVSERRRIEARALAQLQRPQEALAVLAPESGAEADGMRADLHWQARDWGRAMQVLDRALAGREKDAKPLAEEERRRVLQLAIAASLAGDAGRLEDLRSHWAKRLEGSREAAGFQLATARAGADETRLRHLAGAIAQVGQLENFMASTRQRQSAVN
jgi:hypothetical protein